MKTLTAFLFACLFAISANGQNPSANFSASVTSGCSPLTVTFTDESTGNPTNWNWEFSNGTLSSAQNPVVTFNDPGTYSVKLVVKSATGIDQIERINYITVLPSPRVSFQADLTLSCLPAVIHFSDLSSTPVGTLTNWLWTFGDGGTSTDQNPTHSYAATGFYNVSLTVTNSAGCQYTLTADNYIRVVGSVEADFAFSQPSSCQAPFSVSFQNQSSGPGTITYSWDFGNSLSSSAVNPTTIYNATGTYTVRLFGQSNLGCSGSIEKTITITSTTTDFTAPAAACTNQPVSFQNNASSPPATSFWRFGDGTTSAQINPQKTYLTPGTYTVTLINNYDNCIDSVKKVITIGRPAVNFMANDSTSCTAPFNVQFTAIAPGATAWFWDFGDGGTSTLQNPTHQYTAQGNYDVSLTVSTTAGCSSTRVNADFIRIGQPQVSINVPAGGCIPFTYDPEAVIDSPDPIASYLWDLGEPGATFNVENPPSYNYTSAGTFPVSLTVTTVSGCTVTTTIPDGVRTGTPPVVDFSYTPVNACSNEEIQFTDLSVTTPGAEVEWLWVLGVSDTSHQQNPRYGPADTLFPVTLIVSNNGCVRSRTKMLHVQPPIARFKHTVNCTTHEVTFNNTSLVDPTLTPTTYLWTMGDPANTQFTTRNIPPFNYPGLGEYTVVLIVQNGPCSSRESATVRILDERADFTIDRNQVCKGESFTLAAINSDPDHIWQYNWTVGGTTFSNAGPTITHSIATPGTYDVQLRIIDLNGCGNTKSVSGYIRVGGPTARFAPPATICMSSPVTFTDQSNSVNPIVNWHFNFGDGVQQNFSAPPFSHTYTEPGGYIPSLTVTDALGCTDTYTLPDAIILANLKVGFRSETFYCPSKPLLFVDTSEGAGLSYLWTFGDGNTSTDQNPTNIYPADDADYTVSLQVTDISGCQASVTRPDYIRIRNPRAAFDIKDTVSICPPLRTTFTFGGSNFSTYFWDFGDGSTS
ncbi:MAG: PKD domain-containing protein, partial [Chitinophagaceae bacterium]